MDKIKQNLLKLSFYQQSGLVLLTIYSLVIFFYGIYGAIHSSSNQNSFYITSRLLLQRQDPYHQTITYILNNAHNITYTGLNKAGGTSMYPPSTHIVLIPFYAFLLSPEAAQIEWLIGNLIFIGIIYYVLCKKYLPNVPLLYKYILLCLMLGASATKTNLSLGQTSLFCIAAFLLTVFFRPRNKWLSGFSFMLAISKPSLMILYAVYLAIKKEYKIIAIAFLMHLCITILVSEWIGVSVLKLMKNYFLTVALLSGHESGLSFYYQMCGASLKSLFYAFRLPANLINSITVVLYLMAVFYIYFKRFYDEPKMLGLIALLTVLIDYHQHYDFVVLFLLFPIFLQALHLKIKWLFYYYCCLMFLPNLSRLNIFGFMSDTFFINHHSYFLIWQCFYTMLFVFLLYAYIIFFLKESPKAIQVKE